ncbi:MAG TPA: hypothetical protein PKW51_07930 [Methanoregulaceae archaeon]|mgnify:FL=1|nr:hypothetical protein [Methanoregulaceae archaeon]
MDDSILLVLGGLFFFITLITRLSGMGYGITRLEGSRAVSSAVAVLLMVVPRRALDRLTPLLRNEYPDLIYTIEDVRKASEGGKIFFGKESGWISRFLGW